MWQAAGGKCPISSVAALSPPADACCGWAAGGRAAAAAAVRERRRRRLRLPPPSGAMHNEKSPVLTAAAAPAAQTASLGPAAVAHESGGAHVGLTSPQAEQLLAQHGYNEVKAKQTAEWKKIAWRYLDWVCLLIIAAAVVSVAVENHGSRGWLSFALLIIELNLIVWVGYYTERNAGNAIKELEDLAAPQAMVCRDGRWGEMPVRELVPGDLVALKGGDVIPADCKLVGEGEPLKVDESSLTGESLEVTRRPGDKVLAGAVVASGELDAVVVSTGKNTFFGKTMALLAQPQERGHLNIVLGRVSGAIGVLAAAGCIAILAVIIARFQDVGYAFTVAFIILASTIPIGMPVVTGAVLAVGAREMVAEKAIVTRLSALEELSGMEVLCSDKTGTLTLNKLTLDKEDVEAWGGASRDDVLLMASLSAKWSNQDAIDRAVTAAVGGSTEAIAGWGIDRLIPFNPVDKKTVAEVTSPDGRRIITCKGAPQIVRDLLGDPQAREMVDRYIAERASRGLRSLGVANSTDGGASWELVGLISLLDPPRPDSAETIELAKSLGVEVKMVTGDQHAIAVETCRRLGLGTDIMEGAELLQEGQDKAALGDKVNLVDGFAGVYPEHKYAIVEAYQSHGRLVGMTGDGVNDAPALKRANVGIAVAGATSAAKAAADIILTEEGIGTIVTALIRSRKIFRRLETYIVYRMASSITILGFFFFGIICLRLEFPTWVMVLVSLTNDVSVMATSFDKVHSSDVPETANITKCLAVAGAISSVGVGALVLLLALADPTKINWWHIWNVELDSEEDLGQRIITNGQTIACVYMGLTCFIQLSILLTRNPSFWWHFSKKSAPRPSLLLVAPVVAFMLAAMFIAVYWPLSVQPDGGLAVMQGAGWVPVLVTLLYALLWLQVADVAKVLVQRLFHRYEVVKEHCHQHNERLPAWVRAIDAPGSLLERWADWMDIYVARCIAGVCRSSGDASGERAKAELAKLSPQANQAPQQLGLSRVSQRPSGPQPAPSASSPRADYQEGALHNNNLQEVAVVCQ